MRNNNDNFFCSCPISSYNLETILDNCDNTRDNRLLGDTMAQEYEVSNERWKQLKELFESLLMIASGGPSEEFKFFITTVDNEIKTLTPKQKKLVEIILTSITEYQTNPTQTNLQSAQNAIVQGLTLLKRKELITEETKRDLKKQMWLVLNEAWALALQGKREEVSKKIQEEFIPHERIVYPEHIGDEAVLFDIARNNILYLLDKTLRAQSEAIAKKTMAKLKKILEKQGII